jgi:hypothetical protein
MANELKRPRSAPGAGGGNQLDRDSAEGDPVTWYGLVWRIARAAMDSTAATVRVGILLILVCAVLLLAAHAGALP